MLLSEDNTLETGICFAGEGFKLIFDKKFYVKGIHFICFLLIVPFGFAQPHLDKNNTFGQYLLEEHIPLQYKAYKEVKKRDREYGEALLFRNQYGWVMYDTEQLYIDIPALLEYQEYDAPLAYSRVFDAQRFPASEWPVYYSMAEELLQRFDPESPAYREVLFAKISLDLLMRNDEAAARDLPILIARIDPASESYPYLLLWHGISTGRINKTAEAMSIYSKGYAETGFDMLLMNYVALAWHNNLPDSILTYEKEILADTTGALLFSLGDAYRLTGDSVNADICFRKVVLKIKVSKYSPIISLESGMNFFPFDAERLEIVADFYSQSDPVLACRLYSFVPASVADELKADEFAIKEAEKEIGSEERRKEVIAEYEEHSEASIATGKRVELKLQQCKN